MGRGEPCEPKGAESGQGSPNGLGPQIGLESVHLTREDAAGGGAARGALGARQGQDRTAAALPLAASQATVPGG